MQWRNAQDTIYQMVNLCRMMPLVHDMVYENSVFDVVDCANQDAMHEMRCMMCDMMHNVHCVRCLS